MANVFTGTPPLWILDTASNTAVSTDWLSPEYMQWVSVAAAAGDEAKVTDSSGAVVWDIFATGADFVSSEVRFPRTFKMHGLKMATLTSGKVYIYFR